MASQDILSIPCEDHFTKFTLLVKGAQVIGGSLGFYPCSRPMCLGADCIACVLPAPLP